MPKFIDPVPTKGPYTVSVTVTTGDGEQRNDAQIGDCLMSTGGNMQDMLTYEAGKAARRAFGRICWSLVKRDRPALTEADKEFSQIWRATMIGKTITVRTQEEIDAAKETPRAYYWRCVLAQLYYMRVSFSTAVYSLWKAILGKW